MDPEDSLPGAWLERQRTAVLRSCQGADGAGGGRRQLRLGGFATASVTSICREMPHLPVGEGERAPLKCSSNFRELPLI